jgi:predicted RNA-binding Zn ribbon-like protein
VPAPPPLDLVQDFVNTEIPVWAVDDIATPDALGTWLRRRGLLADAVPVPADAFVRARALRRLLRDLARANADGREPDPGLGAELALVTADARLRFVLADGELRLEPDGEGVERAFGEILARVVDAQRAGTWRRLKTCPGPHCGWLFYDGSRNASSRWCSMSICGNRTKTAAYRRRLKDAL